MELTLERPGDHLFIRSFGAHGIQVVDDIYATPIILSAHELISDWLIGDISEFGPDDVDREFDLAFAYFYGYAAIDGTFAVGFERAELFQYLNQLDT